MSNWLIVYDECPDEVRFYVVPAKLAKQYEPYLDMAQNKFMNADDDNEGLEFMCAAVDTYEGNSPEEFPESVRLYHRCLVPYLVGMNEPLKESITRVYYTGFML